MDNASQITSPSEGKKHSVLAIVGLVLGVLALLTSLIPIVNNLSFIVAVPGAICAIAGFVSCRRGVCGNKGVATAAVVVNVVAIVAVLASQSLYSAAIDEAVSGPEVVASDDAASDDVDDADDVASDDASTPHALGTSVELDNGLVVSVDEFEGGLTVPYGDGAYSRVRVTLTNNSDDSIDFGSYNWKSESANGVQASTTYYPEQTEELSSGTLSTLSAGGTVSGNIYFDGDITQVHYFGTMFDDEPTATWTLS